MAMDLDAVKLVIEDAIKTALQEKYPEAPPGNPTSPDDFAGIAEGVSPGIVAALQHILDVAEVMAHSYII